MRKLTVLVAIALMVFACEKDNNGGGEHNSNADNKTIEIAEEETVKNFPAGATTDSVSFTTKAAWISSIEEQKTGNREAARTTDVTWISIAPQSGDSAGSYDIIISVKPNTGAERSAVIIIRSNGDSIAIEVTQGREMGTLPTSFLNPDLTYGSVMDIDNNEYATIQMGTQIWMAENLKTTRYNDGALIPNVTDRTEWINLNTGAWCNSNNDPANDALYGKLYNWYAVNTGKLCPSGWHIPTDKEWTQLRTYIGANVGGGVGGEMKAIGNYQDGTGLWSYPNYAANNKSGFTGLPGGFRNSSGSDSNMRGMGYWWSATERENNTTRAWMRWLYSTNGVFFDDFYEKISGLSCRCVED